MDTDNKSKERRTNFEAQLGQLAIEHWRLTQNLGSIEEKIRLLNGAVQEAENGERDADRLLAIVEAQKEAVEKAQEDSAKVTPKKHAKE
ncbi:MAG TPA: hypothetical protein VNA25_14210 [Phycisphaerae bacterium]|nr:hypothetical protein [Phycisphaerae bacterium]